MIGSSVGARGYSGSVAVRIRYGLAGVALTALLCAGGACGVAEELGAKPSGANEVEDPRIGQPCDTGAAEECHVTVGENGDVLTCLDGERRCVDSAWGPCEGQFSATPAPEPQEQATSAEGPSAHPLSTGTSSA